jgi:hypothetical protein
MREYLKGTINELAMNSKNKNIRDLSRGINEFKRSYQLRNNLVGYLLADPPNILNRWKNYFSQLSNVHNVSDVRQIDVLIIFGGAINRNSIFLNVFITISYPPHVSAPMGHRSNSLA